MIRRILFASVAVLSVALICPELVCPALVCMPLTASIDNNHSSPNGITGVVQDPSGAIIPGASVELLASDGSAVAAATTDESGNFNVKPPAAGTYELDVNLAGFQPIRQAVKVGAGPLAALHIVLNIAAMTQQVHVNGDSAEDLIDSAANSDTMTLSAKDLKSIPVFDNDYVTAMSSFLDAGSEGTAGSGLMVDGVEANRAGVSPSAIQQVNINQEPYAAQYYRPGRGQMEIVTRPTTDDLHGSFNFFFRDSALNAQNAFAATKAAEQRRIYQGYLTGPVKPLKSTSFLFSVNRAEEDFDAIVYANIPDPSNPSNPAGIILSQNIPAPTRNTEISQRVAHQFSQNHSAYLQYEFQDSVNYNQGVGNTTLAQSGTNTQYLDNDVIFHDDLVLSSNRFNQFSAVVEDNSYDVANVADAPRIVVQGSFSGGSAQARAYSSEYNLRLNDVVSWNRGNHAIKFGANLPHFSRRVLEDGANRAGTYTFSSLADYSAGHASGFSIQQGQGRFLYHQREVGGFIQDSIKLTPRFSITPGLRYDWQNLLSSDINNFSPRLSFAMLLNKDTGLVIRGGGGVYYDRTGGGPLVDLARYSGPLLRNIRLSSQTTAICYPDPTACGPVNALPPSIVRLAPGVRTPYQVHYGLSVDRSLGSHATLSVSWREMRGIGLFRSIDINAPEGPDYTVRPDPAYSQSRQIQSSGYQRGDALDISYRGRIGNRFAGFGQYTWGHYANNTDGIYFFPEDQQDPDAEWGRAGWDQRQRFNLFGVINPDQLLNLGIGLAFHTGSPYSITTGEDNYGTDLFNARPEDTPRNSEVGPAYANVDLRWGYDFKLHPEESDKSPTVGFSAAAFNVLNEVNGSTVGSVEGSRFFDQVTNSYPARRIQLGARFNF